MASVEELKGFVENLCEEARTKMGPAAPSTCKTDFSRVADDEVSFWVRWGDSPLYPIRLDVDTLRTRGSDALVDEMKNRLMG